MDGAEISEQMSALVVLEESRDLSTSATEYKRSTLAQFLCSLFHSLCSFVLSFARSVIAMVIQSMTLVGQSAILVNLTLGHLIRRSVTWSANQLVIVITDSITWSVRRLVSA